GQMTCLNLGMINPPLGLYVDNFADTQYPDDRKTVIGEWLQNGQSEVRRTGWIGNTYVPTVRDSGTTHPGAEMAFRTLNGISARAGQGQPVDVVEIRRWDIDARKMNFGPAAGRTRILYAPQIDPQSRRLIGYAPVGPTAFFALPPSGVIFCEGS